MDEKIPLEKVDSKEYDTLVIPGGGIKGFVLLGALHCLHEQGLLEKIKTFVGTSIGSIISYLLIIGYTPEDILIFLYKNKWMETQQEYNLLAALNCEGIYSYTHIKETLEIATTEKTNGHSHTLSSLESTYKKKLVCTTYNFTKCKTEYLSSDNYPDMLCIDALRMSSNLPVIFNRFKYGGSYYIDGGISDNFPIMKASEYGNDILGIFLDLPIELLEDKPEEGFVSYMLKLIHLPIRNQVQLEKAEKEIELQGKKAKIIKLKTDNMTGSFLTLNVSKKNGIILYSEGYKKCKETFS